MADIDTKIALELYTLRDSFGSESEFAEAMRKTRDAGYRAVEIAGVPASIPRPFIKKVLDDNGMICMATQAGIDGLTDNLQATIDELGVLDCSHTALSFAGPEFRSRDGYERLASILNEAATKLAHEGVRLAYHNHSFEFERYDGKPGLEWLYEYANPDLVEAKLDTAWIQRGGADVIEWIKKLGDRMSVIHLKDYTIVDDEIVLAEVGEGNLNWPGILEACGQTNLRWFVVEQDHCQRDPFESIKISYDNLVNLGVK